MHYPDAEDIVSLRFEFDQLAPVISSMDDAKVPRCSDPTYLLFYVRNMSDIIGRIEMGNTGAWVYAYPEQESRSGSLFPQRAVASRVGPRTHECTHSPRVLRSVGSHARAPRVFSSA